MSKFLTHADYTVGWVCALTTEQIAARAMLDEKHADLPRPRNDDNAYILGSIGGHNVVIACLPKGRIGVVSAANVASQMVNTFTSIRFCLMVGIGGGIPSKVKLGDVVVSTPSADFPGVVQWDMGKSETEGFKRTGALNAPPTSLLTAISTLEGTHEMEGSKIQEYLEKLAKDWPRLAAKYLKSESLQDRVFPSNYIHAGGPESCQQCDSEKAETRVSDEAEVHYGLIASGNQVVKLATTRDEICRALGDSVLCIEMEAAGLMNKIPSLVIRGICDYADSHKNKDWQPHAAAVAAAYAKELLEFVQPAEINNERPVKEILETMSDDLSRTKVQVKHIRSQLEDEHDRKILDWLSPTDYGIQQTDFLRAQQPGTGQWFLESQEYTDWLAQPGTTLFCPGLPGAGKTMLSATVVNDLNLRWQSTPGAAVAYVFCNHKRAAEQTAEYLLCSLLKHFLLERPSDTIEHVKKMYDLHSYKRTRPSMDEICLALLLVAECYNERTFMIVDGLDELEFSARESVLEKIVQLQLQTKTNILATARHIPDIKDHFRTAPSLEIRASDGDISAFLDSEISKLRITQDPTLCAEIIETIVKKTDGMFLLAKLYVASLCDKDTKTKIRKALRTFEAGSDAYDAAYEAAMERIFSQPRKNRAQQILMWVTCAKRYLKLEELQHALAVDLHADIGGELDDDNIPQIDTSICAGLVTIDEESGIVRLIHYTTQEYFQRTGSRWFPGAKAEIASVCATYMSFNTIAIEARSSWVDAQHDCQINSFYKFYEYCDDHWAEHGRYARKDKAIIHFLEKTRHAEASAKARFRGDGVVNVYLAAKFGLTDTLQAMCLKPGIDVQDRAGMTPLFYAAEEGHLETVKLLLTAGASANVKDNDGRTALSYAAKECHVETARLLLQAGASADIKDIAGRTPLFYGVRDGDRELVKLLLDAGASADITDRWGGSLLSRAIKPYGVVSSWDADERSTADADSALVTMLLAAGASPNIKAPWRCPIVWGFTGDSPLSNAAERGRKDIVDILLKAGAAIGDHGHTALFVAMRGGHTEVVKLLVENGALGQKDETGITPLSRAAGWFSIGEVRALLDVGASPNAQDDDGKTPLFHAAGQGDPRETLQWIKERAKDDGVSLDVFLTRYPPTHAPARIIEMLLQAGALPDIQDTDGRTALSYVAEQGHLAVAKAMLEGETSADLPDRDGRTPLYYAEQGGRTEMGRLLKQFTPGLPPGAEAGGRK